MRDLLRADEAMTAGTTVEPRRPLPGSGVTGPGSCTDRQLAAWSLALTAAFLAIATVIWRLPAAATWEVALNDRLAPLDAVVSWAWLLGAAPVVALGVVTAVFASVRRGRPRALAVAVLAAPALLLLELVVKPMVGRPAGLEYGFPSGHAAGSAYLAVMVLVAFWPRARRQPAALGAAFLGAVACALWTLASGSHLATDVIGAWLWVGAWVLAGASVGGLLAGRARRPPRHPPIGAAIVIE